LQCRFIESDHQLFAVANDRTPQQIGFRDNQGKEFFACGQGFGKAALFVYGMPRIQKRRNLVITEYGFEFLNGQRLFGVIAFNQIFFTNVFAQETPRVATGGSGTLLPEVSFHNSSLIWDGE
jgi:hypothetical protein